MGLVSAELLARLNKQLAAAGTVVWYDPAGVYADFAAALDPAALGGAQVARYRPDEGFLRLRHALEPLWGPAVEPPRLLIYVPLAQTETGHALVEHEVAGVVMGPGRQPVEQDTALETVARAALAAVLPPAAVERVVAQVAQGQLNLAELDRVAEQGEELRTGALALLFGAGNAHEIALAFLAGETHDAGIVQRNALGDLSRLLSETLGVELAAATPAELRAKLARQVLMTDFLVALGEQKLPAYATFPLAAQPAARQAACKLAAAWRNRLDAAAGYVTWARQVEREMAVSVDGLALESLRPVETFLVCEERAQRLVEEALVSRPSQRLRDFAQKRLNGFWATQEAGVKTRWAIIASAADLLLEAARIENALKGKSWRADALLAHYALGETPWCLLDRAQRHLEHAYLLHDFAQEQETLLKLVAHARQRYWTVAARLAERFITAYADEQFEAPGVPAQADIYAEHVAPAAAQGKTAYILVDGLRYEMAHELRGTLQVRDGAELQMALATVPTITDVGMAALLPGAERGVTLEAPQPGKLAARIDGALLRTRADRVAYFEAKAVAPVVTVRLDQLTPLDKPALRKQIEGARTILVTASDEIDGVWEDNPTLARRTMFDALNQVRRGIHTLFGAGVRHIVVTADHGYLFGDPLTEGDTIDPPGGQTTALKRRVWIGKGGAAAPGILYRPLSAFGIGGDLELATPMGLGCFRVAGGSLEYFHGGLTLQEVVLPVLLLTAKDAPVKGEGAPVEWRLTLGSKTISTRFVSATIAGQTTGLLPVNVRLVRVEVRAGDQVLSTPVAAAYGFRDDTKDIQLKAKEDQPQVYAPNTVTLLLDEPEGIQQVTVHLVDANTGRSLYTLEQVPVSINI